MGFRDLSKLKFLYRIKYNNQGGEKVPTPFSVSNAQ
jgi:hypothetical protein